MAPVDAPVAGTIPARRDLRRRLLAAREAFATLPQARVAQDALAAHLRHLLAELEPASLGLYWPVRGEFNAIEALLGGGAPKLPLALPFAQRRPAAMHYRAWNGSSPSEVDECGVPAPPAAAEVVPDVVLVPCVGFTRSGLRLGYGGGYFDRWLDAHPGVTAIGLAWSLGELGDAEFAPEDHDRPLTLILTERGVVG